MNQNEIQEMLSDLVMIARHAGSIILSHYAHSDQDIQIKDDDSPLTRADIESDAYIHEQLTARYTIPVVSEENYPEYDLRKDYTDFFLVDPLDGTKEFIERNGEFTVNIAYIQDKKPMLGVIFAPATGMLFYAGKGYGSYQVSGDSTQRLPLSTPRREHRVAVGSRKHSTPLDAAFMEMNHIDKIVSAGSSLKFCSVAVGEADLYPRFQGSMEWDIAAGHIIAEEAGCRVVDLTTMQEPEYNKRSLKNNYFLVLRDGIDPATIRIPQFQLSEADA